MSQRRARGDYLYISGDESRRGGGGWLHALRDAHDGGALREIELREPLPPDTSALAQAATAARPAASLPPPRKRTTSRRCSRGRP